MNAGYWQGLALGVLVVGLFLAILAAFIWESSKALAADELDKLIHLLETPPRSFSFTLQGHERRQVYVASCELKSWRAMADQGRRL